MKTTATDERACTAIEEAKDEIAAVRVALGKFFDQGFCLEERLRCCGPGHKTI